jgi:hypothetical protein
MNPLPARDLPLLPQDRSAAATLSPHAGEGREAVVPHLGWGEGRSRDRLFGEEQRQDIIYEGCPGQFHNFTGPASTSSAP